MHTLLGLINFTTNTETAQFSQRLLRMWEADLSDWLAYQNLGCRLLKCYTVAQCCISNQQNICKNTQLPTQVTTHPLRQALALPS